MLLEGEVVKVTSRAIHTVVLGFCAAFIADEDIRDEFRHKSKHGEEVFVSRGNKKPRIKVGTVLRFMMKSFDEDVLHIAGSLAANSTGSAQWLDRNLHEWSQADSTAKRGGHNSENGGLMLKREASSFKNDENVRRAKKRRKDHD